MKTELLKNLSIDDYHASPYVSNSKLQTFLKSGPRGYWMRYIHKSLEAPTTAALRAGQAFDTLLFDGEDEYKAKFIERPKGMKFNTVDGREWKALQHKNGKTIIEPDDARAFQWMVSAIKEHSLASELLETCDYQVSLRGPREGLPGIQSRPDGLRLGESPVVLDLKTTANLDYLLGGSSVIKYGYHQQMAFSSMLLSELGAVDVKYCLLAVEKAAPHRAQVIELSQDYVRAGCEQVNRGLQSLAQHYTSGTWPRVTTDRVVLEPPAWMTESESAESAA